MIRHYRGRFALGTQSRMPSLGFIVVVCLMLGLLLASRLALAAPKSDLWPFWDKADEQSEHQVDHAAWSTLLGRYISHDRDGNALVDYQTLKARDAGVLASYIANLTQLDPRILRKAEQMAYWINLYNALTVQLVIDAYPVASIRKIKGGWFDSGPWDEKLVSVAGKKLTLNDIEHRILRPIWKDRRIHYAVNCASIGCPNLATQAFQAAQLEAQLDQAATTFINQPKGVQILGAGRFQLSSIYDWYGEDFGTKAELFEHLQSFHADQLLPQNKQPIDIDYAYNWDLNDSRGR